MNEDYLAHYGVLGMKWGVRKDPEKAYTKAKKKAYKLVKGSDDAMKRAGKYNAASHSRLSSRRQRAKFKEKAHNARTTAIKYSKKADKWINSMKKEFAKQNVVTIEKDLLDTGKKMVERYDTLRTLY